MSTNFPFEKIPYTKPSITELEIRYASDAAINGWGEKCYEYIEQFEEKFKQHLNCNYALATSSCTGAIHMGLHALGIGHGDEVILGNSNWVATAAPIIHLGATPIYVDILENTWCLDPKEVEDAITPKTKAIIAVHLYGNLCDMNALLNIGKKYNIPIIEDSAEALGSRLLVNNQFIHCGLFSEIGVLSFNGNKLITTGGGGALITNNSKYAITARHLSTTAKIPHEWEFIHDYVGWNDRMPNINAALGVAQIENIYKLLENKKNLFTNYLNAFKDCQFAEIIKTPDNSISNNWLIALRLKIDDKDSLLKLRKDLLEESINQGLHLRPSWKLLNTLPMYINSPKGDLSIAKGENERIISLPSSPQLDKS